MPAYRSVGIYTSCSVARSGQRYIEFVGDWIRSEEVDFLVGGHPRPSHDPRQDHSLEAAEWRRRSCKGIRLRIRNDKILTKRVSPSPPLPPLPPSLSFCTIFLWYNIRASNWHSHEKKREAETSREREKEVARRGGVGQQRNDPRNSMVENKPNWRTCCFVLEETVDTRRGPVKMYF